MKLISLNTWGGRKNQELQAFFKDNQDVDIFCLQEILSSGPMVSRGINESPKDTNMRLFADIAAALPDHTGIFAPTADYIDVVHGLWVDGAVKVKRPLSIGNAMFIRKENTIEACGDYFIYGNRNYKSLKRSKYSPKSIQYAVIKSANGFERYSIFNVHGIWNGGGKKDSKQRLRQSDNIADFINHFGGKRILSGDFNLDPDTLSLRNISAKTGMIDLIREHSIKSTRTKLYRHYLDGSLFADYMFVTPDVDVMAFNVLDFEASDHSPLLLRFV